MCPSFDGTFHAGFELSDQSVNDKNIVLNLVSFEEERKFTHKAVVCLECDNCDVCWLMETSKDGDKNNFAEVIAIDNDMMEYVISSGDQMMKLMTVNQKHQEHTHSKKYGPW